MNNLNHVVNTDIKIKDQCNDAIAYEPEFDNTFSLYRDSIRYPLSVVTVTLIVGKKNRSNVIYVLTFLWDSGATDSMIKRKYTRPYEYRMRSNKVE